MSWCVLRFVWKSKSFTAHSCFWSAAANSARNILRKLKGVLFVAWGGWSFIDLHCRHTKDDALESCVGSFKPNERCERKHEKSKKEVGNQSNSSVHTEKIDEIPICFPFYRERCSNFTNWLILSQISHILAKEENSLDDRVSTKFPWFHDFHLFSRRFWPPSLIGWCERHEAEFNAFDVFVGLIPADTQRLWLPKDT